MGFSRFCKRGGYRVLTWSCSTASAEPIQWSGSINIETGYLVVPKGGIESPRGWNPTRMSVPVLMKGAHVARYRVSGLGICLAISLDPL